MPVYGDIYPLINDQPQNASLSAQAAGLPAAFPLSLRSRMVTLNPVIASTDVLVPGDMMTLNLFADTVLTAKVDAVSGNVNGTVTIRGRLADYPLGYVIATTTDNKSLATIRIPETGKRYRIQRDALSAMHYLFEENTSQVDELKDGRTLIPPTAPGKDTGMKALADNPAGDPLAQVTIDVMFVYTPAARQWADEENSGIGNLVAMAVAEGQLCLDNSDTFVTLNLVHLSEVNYIESGDSYTDLYRLTGTSDGYMDSVHTLRNQYGADIVTLLTEVDDLSGLGWILNTTSGQPEYAFSITRVQQAGQGYIYIHEIGHNMGCHHRKDQAAEPGPGLFSYSAGWHWIGNDSGKYCSVMSYWDGGYGPVAHFSNPSIMYQGVPTGHPADGDNARTIREIKGVVAAYIQPAQTGSFSVTITPQGAIDAGAQWRRTGTSIWRDSGFIESGLAVGQYQVEFSSIPEWKAPASQLVEVNDGQTTYAIGTYTLYPAVFTPDGGSYSSKQDVTITCDTPEVTIHYTTNGNDPTESNPVIDSGASLLVGHTLILKAKAWKTGIEPSEITTADYQINLARPEADLDDDCIVNFKDFALLGNWWLYDCNTSNNWCAAVDFDLSGDAGIKDLAVLASQWLTEGNYVLNVNSSFESPGASISSSTGHGGTTNYTQMLTAGTSVTLTAPAVVNDRTFTEWTDDVSSINQTISFSMDADKTVTANYGLLPIILVDINDPGFKGQMSKYETTNAQYCQFLNDAKAAGLITVYTDNIVYATSDTEHLYPYYITYNETITSQIAWSGGTFSVHSRDGYSMDNHPVNNVSWYGATAFCDYYGYRLPTQWEWRAVADFDGSYIYGCGTMIDHSKANYWDDANNDYANPLGLSYYPYTTQAGYYPAYGYGMCDMAGNAGEWTSSCYYPDCSGSYRVLRGGDWAIGGSGCLVSYRTYCHPYYGAANIGFRGCRGETVTIIVPDVSGMTQAEALASLDANGLLVGTPTEEFSDTVAAGHIISQNPAAGEEVLQGSTANLIVSKGPDIVWVSISDPGFNGQMSKYETTNAQYCQFLNDAKAAGLITVYTDNIVYATSDTEHLYPYFRIYPDYFSSQIAYSGGTFNVRSRDGYSMDDHPVTDVSGYGATAFCDYYGYRLPTESEWQAVADFDGSYSYGCGTTIDQSKANYWDDTNGNSNPLHLTDYPYTSPVGYYPAYGYGMCDMAGNAWEWTSSYYLRGGNWNGRDSGCLVWSRDYYPPYIAGTNFGFRVCR